MSSDLPYGPTGGGLACLPQLQIVQIDPVSRGHLNMMKVPMFCILLLIPLLCISGRLGDAGVCILTLIVYYVVAFRESGYANFTFLLFLLVLSALQAFTSALRVALVLSGAADEMAPQSGGNFKFWAFAIGLVSTPIVHVVGTYWQYQLHESMRDQILHLQQEYERTMNPGVRMGSPSSGHGFNSFARNAQRAATLGAAAAAAEAPSASSLAGFNDISEERSRPSDQGFSLGLDSPSATTSSLSHSSQPRIASPSASSASAGATKPPTPSAATLASYRRPGDADAASSQAVGFAWGGEGRR